MKNIFAFLLLVMVLGTGTASANPNNSCWGEATAIFAQMGEMGEHSSAQAEPRLGLANLARALFDLGIIAEPTLGALADFVAAELGLVLEKCLTNQAAVMAAESAAETNAACWGQASAVFAQLGEMGAHSSSQANPRIGLRNLARLLFELGVIADDSMAALGAFVADELGLSIEACQ